MMPSERTAALRLSAWPEFCLTLMIGRRGRCSRRGALARQAQIFAVAPAIESLGLEPHFVCVYPVSNERATVITNKRYLDH
jgi:hypothetical protein